MRFDLSDEEWTILEPLIPGARRSRRIDDRRIMNGFSLYCARASLGGTYPSGMAHTRRPITASIAGRRAASGAGCLRLWRPNLATVFK
jgi:transposase